MKYRVILLTVLVSSVIFAQVKQEGSVKSLSDYLLNMPKSDSAVEALEKAIVDGDEKVRMMAFDALINMTGPQAKKVLNRYVAYGLENGTFNDPTLAATSPIIRAKCAVGLSRNADAAAAARLREVLFKENNRQAMKAEVWALGELKDKEAIGLLTDIVVHQYMDESLIKTTAEALGKIGDKSAFYPLLLIRSGVFSHLTKITAQTALDSLTW